MRQLLSGRLVLAYRGSPSLEWSSVFEHIDVPGAGICPVPGLLTESHGTLHDDERGNVDCSVRCNSDDHCAMTPGTNGYGTGCASGYADNANWCAHGVSNQS